MFREMKVFSAFVMFLVFLNNHVDEAEGNCILHIDKDFGNPSPVLVQNGEFLAPNDLGVVTVQRAGKLTAACPGTNRFLVLGNDTTDFKVLDVRCKSGVIFAVGRWEGPFKNITCNGQPWTSSQEAGRCYGGVNTLYKVGFQVGSTFHSLYEACLNNDLVTTTYVRHRLLPTAVHIQLGKNNRPSFIEGGLFNTLQVSKLYGNKQQRERLNSVLGEGMADEYITKKQFLSRGHLAPRADFSLRTVQRTTFHFVNVAPQWMRINAGDWAALEEALRRRAATLNATLEVTTGTLGVLTLPDQHGRDTPLYLADDDNNNGIVPVPMYFFKLVHDPRRKLATAFVTINSSFYNTSTTERLTFCDDVCADKQLRWLHWRSDGAHSFCCSYAQFMDTVKFIPPLDTDVLGDLD